MDLGPDFVEDRKPWQELVFFIQSIFGNTLESLSRGVIRLQIYFTKVTLAVGLSMTAVVKSRSKVKF